MKKKANPVDVLDLVYHEAALVESEHGRRTPAQMRCQEVGVVTA